MKTELFMLLLMFIVLILSVIDLRFGRSYVDSYTPRLDNLPPYVREHMSYDNFDPETWKKYQQSVSKRT